MPGAPGVGRSVRSGSIGRVVPIDRTDPGVADVVPVHSLAHRQRLVIRPNYVGRLAAAVRQSFVFVFDHNSLFIIHVSHQHTANASQNSKERTNCHGKIQVTRLSLGGKLRTWRFIASAASAAEQ